MSNNGVGIAFIVVVLILWWAAWVTARVLGAA